MLLIYATVRVLRNPGGQAAGMNELRNQKTGKAGFSGLLHSRCGRTTPPSILPDI